MIAAVVQARMGSTRLPDKTLAPILGKPLLERVIERVRASRHIERVVIATTQAPADDLIVQFGEARDIPVVRGSEMDVLDRMYRAASAVDASVMVRVTPDDPFKDPAVIDKVIDAFLGHVPGPDYASNTMHPTYPEGLDIEVVAMPALERAWHEATLPSEREHVTPYIWKRPDRFRLLNVEHDRDLSRLRWTIDYPEDLAFAREVYGRLHPASPLFGMDEILALLEREPAIAEINAAAGHVRNEGYIKSLKAEG